MRFLPAAWRLELLGWLRAHNDEGTVITRFQTHQTGALLAHLALNLRRSHTREELGDILWPEADMESMRHRFRQALSSLRKQLEPPGTLHGSIIVADRWNVSLNSEAIATDVTAFDEALKSASLEQSAASRLPIINRALDLYRGELLPGFYEDCFAAERQRLIDAHQRALEISVATLESVGDIERAIEHAKQLLDADSLREESHVKLMRLYDAMGMRSLAMRQYRSLERLLAEQLGDSPSQETQSLFRRIAASRGPASEKQATDVRRKSPAPLVRTELNEPARPRLPMQFTRFFGRSGEIAMVEQHLRGANVRLLTIVGMGGVGKTRLAIKVAEECAGDFRGNVYFVLLAPLDDPSYLLDSIGKSMGIQRLAGMTVAQQIIKLLNSYSRILLVLDNFEHLLGAAGDVRDLLAEAPGLTFLITSRRRLGIEGETLLQLAPLPEASEPSSAGDLLKMPRVQMLVDRARAVMPDFQLTERNAATISEICRKLEGIPLAIELAAAWARVLSPSQMLEQLSNRFNLLVSKRQDLDERHRTLRAALDYSFSQVEPQAQQVFAQLSIFRGGWTLEAASQVCNVPNGYSIIGELLDWSLIVHDGMQLEQGSDIRFGMMDTMEEYAGSLLSDAQREALLGRRYDYFLSFVLQSERAISGPDINAAVRKLDAEYANISACLRVCEEAQRPVEGLQMAVPLFSYWILRGSLNEARYWLKSFLAMSEASVPPPLSAEASYCVTRLSSVQGDYEVAALGYDRSARDFEACGSLAGKAKSLNQLGFCRREQGRLDEATRLHEESLALARQTGEKAIIGSALANLGTIAAKEGNLLRVVELYEESLGFYRDIGDPFLLCIALNNYGFSLLLMNDFENAEPHIVESLAFADVIGLHATLTARINLSYIHVLKQEIGPAKALLQDALIESSRYELRRQLYCCLGQLSMLARQEHRYEQSAILLFGMLGLSTALGLDSDDPYLIMSQTAMEEYREVLSPVAFALAGARGRSMPLKDLVELARRTCLSDEETVSRTSARK